MTPTTPGAGGAARRVFWCGDSCLRGCLLHSLLESAGWRVLVPAGPPRRGTLRLPRRGSTYSHPVLARALEAMGCRVPGGRGRGDVDVLAVKGGVGIVLEVKSRIIARTVSRHGWDAARLMLQYHLDEPRGALEAWRILAARGLLEEGWDSESSVSELTRSASAVLLGLLPYTPGRVIVGAAVPFYARPLLGDIAGFVEASYEYLRRCFGGAVAGHATLLVGVDRLGTPGAVRVEECIGSSCSLLDPGGWARIEGPVGAFAPCSLCRYRGFCRRHFANRIYHE